MPLVARLLQLVTVDPSLRRTYAHARRLLRGDPSQERIIAAASLLQIRGLHEEAVGLLLHYRLADQAARVLLQQCLPERAGLIYAKAGQWERAAFCFGQARLWQKAAYCCVCHRDFATAASYYAKAGSLAEAAQYCIKAGDLAGAFAHYGSLGELGNAASVLKQWRLQEREERILEVMTAADRATLAKIQAAKPMGPRSPVATTKPLFKIEAETAMIIRPDTALLTRPGVLQLEPGPVSDVDGGEVGEYRPTWLDAPTMVAPLAGGKLDVAEFFQHFSRSDRDKLWRLGRVIECHAGDVIVDYDDEPPGLYTVLDGNLDIFRDRDQSEKPADQIGAKVSFGQFWAVMRLKSHVRVTASRSCKIHMISRQDLVKVLRLNDQTHQALRQSFMSILFDHLQSSILLKNL